jgi:hypothetical protein
MRAAGNSELVCELLQLNPHVPAAIVPTHLRLSLELHDASLVSVGSQGFTLDAYVHRWLCRDGTWMGSGWIQRFRIDLRLSARPRALTLPQSIAGGALVVSGTTYIGLVPYPVPSVGSARVSLELCSAESVEFEGELASIRAVREARFVETLPPELAPELFGG